MPHSLEALHQSPLRLEELVVAGSPAPRLHELPVAPRERRLYETGRVPLRPELRVSPSVTRPIVAERHEEQDEQLGENRAVALLRPALGQPEFEERTKLPVAVEPGSWLLLLKPEPRSERLVHPWGPLRKPSPHKRRQLAAVQDCAVVIRPPCQPHEVLPRGTVPPEQPQPPCLLQLRALPSHPPIHELTDHPPR